MMDTAFNTDPIEGLEVGYDIPAKPGMAESEIQTPCLLVDLDALERNIVRMGEHLARTGMRLRAHGKMHKSVDVAKLQIAMGGAVGVCCQKVAEAEAFVRGGISDVLVSNQVRGAQRLDRLARLPQRGATVSVCVDDVANVAELSEAAVRNGTTLGCLVEIDCGSGRCGVATPEAAVEIAKAVDAAPGLTFEGIQSYQGRMQHFATHAERVAAFAKSEAMTRAVADALTAAGLAPRLVSGGGTGSYMLESASDVYNELQCGSYAFMDVSYGRILDEAGHRLDAGTWENALFVFTSVMSHPVADRAVCDAGLKALAMDSGLPTVFGRTDVEYAVASDEHGVIKDPSNALKVGDQLRLVPGHCDPTCNLYDHYVAVRDGRVEALWPVSARGKLY
ncbi:DSD1 family PLP-dependent enzyme [Acuticoccus sp. M5D2P5]|uniref:DSD1 family PLP-dependent enzyme n=1 Tax=Acuticoccus kalidii TaxID=2910977 RepID=UPI001F3FD999|nr:DSD1 family PLP-dependent enzyme [Acuticoccus kalidii]MCF3932100.1 DSD1 family PLP-dependent enzyme [Acuticoccus kalidii]